MTVTQEAKDFAKSLLISMMITDRAEKEKRDSLEMFREFRRSNTMRMVYDEETGLWMNGPDYLADEWDMERAASIE